jgi:hypothetical protein
MDLEERAVKFIETPFKTTISEKNQKTVCFVFVNRPKNLSEACTPSANARLPISRKICYENNIYKIGKKSSYIVESERRLIG